VIDAWKNSVETGEPYPLELRHRRADGVYRWFQARTLPTRDAAGRITGWYMLLTDFDDRNRAEHARRWGGAKAILATGTSGGAMGPLVSGLAARGKLIVVGVPGDQIQLNAFPLVFGGRSIYEDEIRLRAYEIYLERGAEPGREMDDWLQAERELERGSLRQAQGG
jgi:hypothetical protein